MISTGGRDRLVRDVERALADFAIGAGERMVVAVSGGADSTALLCALCESRRIDIQLTAVHVVHGIRTDEETAAELTFLEGLCAHLRVAFRVETIPRGKIRSVAEKEHRSLEEVARTMRYERLEHAAHLSGSTFIAVGHTLDDQLETLLMRLLQGGSLRGMAGIPPRRGRVVRPLLGCDRAEILAFLESRGIDYRFDTSNADERYLRNRVRRRVVPGALGVFPNAARSAGRLAAEARGLDAVLEQCARILIPWEAVGSGFCVASERFFGAPGELRMRSILGLYDQSGLGSRIPRGFVDPVARARPRHSGGLLLEGHGASVVQDGDSVFWRPAVVLKTKRSYLMHVFEPSIYHITPALCFRVSTVPKGSAGGRGIALPESLVRHPLVVRSRKPGDTIHMKKGTKSLKKLFNEWGVAESHRDAIPIVEDRGGIWAVCGRALGYQDRVRFSPGSPADQDLDAERIFFAFDMTGDHA